MKQKLIVIASMLIIALSASSQKQSSKKIAFGIKVGLGFSNLSQVGSGGTPFDLKSIFSYSIGCFSNLNLNKSVAIRPELFYAKEGALVQQANTTIIINYVNVPILLKYTFDDAKKISGILGPQIGFFTSGKSANNDLTSKDIKSTNFSIVLGGMYNINKNISIDARYQIGLSNINSDNTVSIKSTVMHISLAYAF